MIASLRMYDRPEIAGANDRLWRLVRRNLGYGPERLDRETGEQAAWTRDDLLLAQTCGLPYRTMLHDRVQLVGTPDYGLSGSPPGHYHSVFVARRDAGGTLAELAAGRFAFNDVGSQSGWAAPAAHARANGLRFGSVMSTGSHAASARAVADGKADLAALDAQSWRLIERHDGFAAGLHVIARTAPTPGLPLITGRDRDAAAIFDAVAAAIGALERADREALGLRGMVRIAAEEYLSVPPPPRPADMLA